MISKNEKFPNQQPKSLKEEANTGLYQKYFDSKPVTRAAKADDVDDNAWTRRLEPLC